MPLMAQRLTAGYAGRDALHAVDCEVIPGTVSILIGPNGSGKSTLLRCLARGLPPRQGRVLLEGDDLYVLPPHAVAARIAYVAQNNPFHFSFTVQELVHLGAAAASHPSRPQTPGSDAHERVEQALRALDLDALAARSLLALSGGEQQRAAIARALAQDTPYLLLDEPTAHLDLRHQNRLLHLLRHEARAQHKAVLIVLHDVNLAAAWADRLILMHQGRIAASGEPTTVLTPETLASVYQTDVLVQPSPSGQSVWVSPAAVPTVSPPRAEVSARIHLLCGGGAGTPLMQALHAAGLTLTAGVLSPTDMDAHTARALKIPYTPEAPFSPISPAALEADAKLRRAADYVIVAPFPIGAANLALLTAAAADSAAAGSQRLLLVNGGSVAARDFTGGEGERQWQSLRQQAYRIVDTPQALVDCVLGVPGDDPKI